MKKKITAIHMPEGRALEYGDAVLNIYTGCNHGCNYPCYARLNHERWHGKGSFDQVAYREGLIEALQAQLTTGKYVGKTIWLCDMCDPYPAPPVDTTPTREIIRMLKDAGSHVQVLTKGGTRATRDFDLLDSGDLFGVTLSGFEDTRVVKEPNASPMWERLWSLTDAKRLNLQTWASFEPVVDESFVYQILRYGDMIDLFWIGKLNYCHSDTNWKVFALTCLELGKQFNRQVKLKKDLRDYLSQTEDAK